MPRRHLLAPSALALCMLAPHATLGAPTETEPGASADTDLETITIIGRISRSIATTEASVSIIDSAQIEDALATTLRDLVAREPGVSIRGDATRFGDDSITIRGISGNRVRLDLDDIPQPSAFAVGNFSDAGRSLMDLDFVKRIEILKGPASATYGSAAIGGIVAVRTFDPKDLTDDPSGLAARAKLRYATVNDGRHASLLFGSRGKVDWLIGWQHQDLAETENGSDTLAANPQAIKSDSWLGKWILSEFEHPLRLSLYGRRRETQTAVNSLILQPGRFANTISMQGDDRTEESKLSVDQTLFELGGVERLDWKVWAQRNRTVQLTFESRRAAGPRTPTVDLERSFRYDIDAAGTSWIAASSADLGRTRHRWSAGFEASVQRVSDLRDGLQTTVATGATTNTILGETFPVRDFPRSRIVEAGAFIFDEITVADSALIWSPALRIDHYRLEPRADPLYAEDNPTQTPVAVRNTSISPRLGVSRPINESLVVFAQYTHGFRSPPFEDVNIGLDIPLFRYRAIPNPDLRPERSDHIEVGARLETGAVSGSASAYGARYRDFIESRVSLGIDADSGYTIFQSRNISKTQIIGAEAKFDALLGTGPVENRHWKATVAIGLSRGKDASSGAPLNSIDPGRATLALKYFPLRRNWHAEAVLTAVAKQTRVDESLGPLARTGGYATLDLLGFWEISETVHLRAAVMNILDRRYSEWSDVRGRTPDDPSLPLYLRPGRSATLGVTLRLD